MKGFCKEEFCDDLNREVVEIIHTIVKEEDEFSHAYAGNGHIAIREMKPNKNAKNIEDEISKLFRIHSTGSFKDFILREDLLDILEDLLGSDIDCFLSQFIFKNLELGDNHGIKTHLTFLSTKSLKLGYG